MSEDAASQRSRRVGGTLTLAAVLVAYLLGVPPLVYYFGPSLPGKKPSPHSLCPDWVKMMAVPWDWLCNRPFLNKPMSAYELWWVELAGVE